MQILYEALPVNIVHNIIYNKHEALLRNVEMLKIGVNDNLIKKLCIAFTYDIFLQSDTIIEKLKDGT
jgi:hypothetical protein